MPDLTIRLATAADLPAVNAIYNHYVRCSTCTYQTEPSTDAERAAWFAGRDAGHPVTVATIGNEVVGWGALSRFHPRAAYGRTVENAVYVHHERHRQGIGSALLAGPARPRRRGRSPRRDRARSTRNRPAASRCTAGRGLPRRADCARWVSSSGGGSTSSTCSGC
jgi:GNAT superfamily N-acetyltransferase